MDAMKLLVKEAVKGKSSEEWREGVEVDDYRKVHVRGLGKIKDRDMQEEAQEMNQGSRKDS